MMELNKINGSTYYIDAPTNIGIYTFKNKNCLIVDTGINNGQAKKIVDVLKQNSLHPKFIINTHGHIDHCGGNLYFVENFPGCIVYSSEPEKKYIENPLLHPTIIYSSLPLKSLIRTNNCSNVNYIINEGIQKLNDEKFEIISLPGHSAAHIGIITDDRVAFCGDSVFSREILKKYSFPYLFDIDSSIKTLNKIKEIDADYFILSHSPQTYTKQEIIELADYNIGNIENYKNMILDLLDQPLSRENILENIMILNDLNMDTREYFLSFSSLSAFLKNLNDNGLIQYSMQNGNLYFYKNT